MQLQEFVTESLLQIANGVSEAQRKIVGNAQINPRLPDHANVSSGHFTKIPKDMILLRDGEVVTMVQFDVAVTTTEGTGTKGGIGVVSGILNLGSSGQSDRSNSAVTRLQFAVPMVLPGS